MPAKDLGTKYTCFKCSTKFYDMKKPEPLCPKCGADQRESPALRPPEKTRRRSSAVAVPVVPAPAPVEEEALEDELPEDDDTELDEGDEDI